MAIAGGGPAGTTTAALLAKLGYDVALLESRRFPRPHIGESLTPGIQRSFEFLELRETIDRAGFVRMSGHTAHWNGESRTHRFADERGQPASGYQVWRQDFDRLLWEHAQAQGAHLWDDVRVTGTVAGGGVSYVTRTGATGHLSAPWVIDASGRSGILARRLALRQPDSAPPSLSLWAYWTDATAEVDDRAADTMVESFADGWIWSVPSRPGWRNVTVNVDLETSLPDLRRLGPVRFYEAKVASAPLAQRFVHDQRRLTRIRGCDTTWYRSRAYLAPGVLLAGDAATLIDPLTSQGVRKALRSAIHAAAAAHTLLERPNSEAIVAQFLAQQEEGAYERYRWETTRAFLEETRFENHPYWQRRSARTLGTPPAARPTPRHGALRDLVRTTPLQRILIRAAEDVEIKSGVMQSGAWIEQHPLLHSTLHPTGRTYPSLNVETAFQLLSEARAIPNFVDAYLQKTGGSRDARAEVMTLLERLVADRFAELQVLG